MANPVFDRLNKQISKGDYAGFGGGSATSRQSGGGVQDSLNSQQLQDLYNQPSAGAVQMRRVTLDDVVMKTLGLFSTMVLVAAATWFYVSGLPSTSPAPMALMLAGMLGGLGIGLVIAFKKTISVPLIVLYAVLEGVLVGAISQVFERQMPGIVSTAVIATLCTFAGMLLGYKTGLIKVTDKSRRIFGMAIMGYLLFGLVNLVAAFMGVGSGFGFGGTGPLGIAISVLGVGLASYSLAIDFDSVDRAVNAQLPEKYSWLLAHGFIVTLVWLYLEILRLLARLRQ
ncbi:MAG: Bax inhibitor-1/YccA family protein [Dermatophilaceae bacterium]|nr:Bax inhibitor-1/YccA family protein [Dermatophilaceae bacterium]